MSTGESCESSGHSSSSSSEQQLLLLQQQDQQRRQQDEVRRRQQQAARAAVAWTADEESRLRQLVDELGAPASKETIAARLGTGRTPAAVQEHWRVMHAPRAAGGGTAAAPQSETIRIPAGAKPGQELRVSLASGKVVFVRVPPNVAPGHLLKVVNGPPPASAAPLPVATPADMAALSAGVI